MRLPMVLTGWRGEVRAGWLDGRRTPSRLWWRGYRYGDPFYARKQSLMHAVAARKAEESLARVEALADEWQGEARAHREAAIRDADIERDWIAGAIEHRLTYLRRALRGDDA